MIDPNHILKWPSSQAVRSGTGNFFEYDFMASEGAHGSYKPYRTVPLTF